MNRKDQFIETIHNRSKEIRELGVKEIGLFGSVQRGDYTNSSDIDVLVDFLPGQKSFDRFFAIHDLLAAELGCKIELITPRSLSPVIGSKILNEVEYVEIPD